MATSSADGKLQRHQGLTCQVCGGPIATGELAHLYEKPEGGFWACHWFSVTCKDIVEGGDPNNPSEP